MTTDNHLKGHKSLAEMVSTHIDIWREALAALLLNNGYDHTHVEHELKALADIDNACKVEMARAPSAPPVERVHPDHTDSTLNAALPTWSDLSVLMRGLYSASFDYGAASMKDEPNPHYFRVSNAQGRMRYALHVLLGTEPADGNELWQINRARRDDGRPEIKVRGIIG